MATYILLMGVQGAGKGTQAGILKEDLALPHISTGDLFRAMKKLDTPLAREVQDIMNAGKLVPDELTLRVVEDRLTQPDTANGALFDGFPRTIPQAEGLDRLLEKKGTKVAVVIFLKLSREEAVRRISARWQNPNDPNDIYNLLTNPPKVAGRSDKDGAILIQRPDDTPDAAAKRIDLFFQETAPLFEFYRQRGILVEIDANQSIEAVTADIKAAIGKATA